MEFSHCRYRIGVVVERSFTPREYALTSFCSCDLDLDPMTFIYELDPYSLEIYRICKNELFTPSRSYDRHAVHDVYRQPDRHDRIPLQCRSRVVKYDTKRHSLMHPGKTDPCRSQKWKRKIRRFKKCSWKADKVN